MIVVDYDFALTSIDRYTGLNKIDLHNLTHLHACLVPN